MSTEPLLPQELSEATVMQQLQDENQRLQAALNQRDEEINNARAAGRAAGRAEKEAELRPMMDALKEKASKARYLFLIENSCRRQHLHMQSTYWLH